MRIRKSFLATPTASDITSCISHAVADDSRHKHNKNGLIIKLKYNMKKEIQIPQLLEDAVSDSFYYDDEDSLLDYYFESEPDLTEEEQIKKLDELNKCADFILKNKITPNMDGIY